MLKRYRSFLQLFFVLVGTVVFSGSVENGVSSLHFKNTLAQDGFTGYNHFAFSGTDYASGFDSLGITLHPGSEYAADDNTSPSSLNHCKSLVYRTLKSLPSDHSGHLRNLTLYFSDTGRRGLGGGSTIILRCHNVTDAELVGVLVHEIGHIVDTGKYQGNFLFGASGFRDGDTPVYNDDPSKDFYALSFVDEKTLRADASPLDFVSGYGMSDPFEDFAESYNYYVLHGNEFRKLARSNHVLRQKYNFLKTRIFGGKEYVNGQGKVDLFSREYDATQVEYDMDRFFAI